QPPIARWPARDGLSVLPHECAGQRGSERTSDADLHELSLTDPAGVDQSLSRARKLGYRASGRVGEGHIPAGLRAFQPCSPRQQWSGLRDLSRADRQDGGRRTGRAHVHGMVSGLSPAAGALPAAERSDHPDGIHASVGLPTAKLAPHRAGGHPATNGLLGMPLLTVAGYWRNLNPLILKLNGLRKRLDAKSMQPSTCGFSPYDHD